MSDLRLNNMMASHCLSEEARRKVLERLVEANVASDDPMSVIFVLEANIEQGAEALASLPDQMASRLRTDLTDSNSALVFGLRETVKQTLKQTSTQAIQGARRNSTMHLVASFILAMTAVGGFGVAVGVQLGQDRSASFLETLAATPDAEAWQRLMSANEGLSEVISTHCVPGNWLFVLSAEGKPACYVPLWIDTASPPPRVGFPKHLRAEVNHRFKTIPAWLTLVFGGLITLATQPLMGRIFKDNSQDDRRD